MKDSVTKYLKRAALLAAVCIPLSVFAADNYKYGKVTVAELEQTVCPFDSTADAMYIYHGMSARMNTNSNEILLQVDYKRRIKVLTEEGKEEADIKISYYHDPNNASTADNITGLTATVYNLENGKVVSTKFEKSYVSEEQTSDYIRTTKVALPNVKVGSVIEYKYTLNSQRYYYIPTWLAQRALPVMQCHCDVSIPEYFLFNQSMSGGCNIRHKEEEYPSNFFGRQVNTKSQSFDAENLPGVKNEKFVYGIDAYVGSVNFELRSIEIPGQYYKDFSKSWANVREQLLGDSDFARFSRIDNPFKEEMGAIAADTKTLAKAQKIYSLLKQKVKWNEYYSLVGKNPKNAVKEGQGSNAQLNFLLMSMFRDAGIRCTPLLVKYRTNGPLPLTRATIDELNTFVVAFCDEEKNLFFIDGSADFGGINVLPTKLLGEGILLEPQNVAGQIGTYRLSEIGGASQSITNVVKVDASGKISGSRRSTLRGFCAQDYKQSLHNAAGDTTAFLKRIEDSYGIKVNTFRFNDLKNIETLAFTADCDVAGDEIYVNALGVQEEHNNPFTAETRQLPIMFPYPQTIQITASIMIPEGYEVASIPEETGIQTSDRKLGAMLKTKADERMVITNYTLEVNAPLEPIGMYQEIREFWKKLIEMNSQMIVFKKK